MGPIDRIERRLKLHDVRVLMSVVEAGSMAKAAQRLGTSQPAVSRSIADLEHTLSVRLLERSAWGVAPTQYGEAIIRRGVAVFDELRQGVKDVEFLADPTAGELRIGCPEAIASGPVLAVINRLTRRHPRIVFHVMTGTAPLIHRALMDRTIEVGIMRVMGRVDEEVLRADAAGWCTTGLRRRRSRSTASDRGIPAEPSRSRLDGRRQRPCRLSFCRGRPQPLANLCRRDRELGPRRHRC